MKLSELREKLNERRDRLAKAFEEGKTESGELDMSQVKSLEGDTSLAKVEKMRQLNAEIDELASNVEQMEAVEKSRDKLNQPSRPQFPGKDDESDHKDRKASRSIGEQIVKHELFEEWQAKKSRGEVLMVEEFGLKELKADFLTSAGWPPESTRTGIVIDEPTRPIQVIDVVPSGQTGQAAVLYMEETTRTHNAAEVAEGGAYAESEFVLEEKNEPVRKIGDSVPVSDEQLDDVAMAQSYLDQRLRFGVRQRLDGQILNGDGTAPNLEGVLNRTGLQTQAKGTDPIPDAVHKAMTKVRVTGRAQPGAVMFHSNDWQKVRLLRTSDGIYIWGSPSEAGPARIWGLPVVQTEALTEGTALTGDFANFSQLFERRGLEVSMGFVGSQFTQGMQTMRADMRVALAVYRPAAFCEVTGL